MGAAPVRPARVTPKIHGHTKQGRPKKNKSRKTIYRTCPAVTPPGRWARMTTLADSIYTDAREERLRKVIVA